MPSPDFKYLSKGLQIPGDFVEAAPYGSGHINDTFAAIYSTGDSQCRYILQRINHQVFSDPLALMDNVSRVTRHARDVLDKRQESQPERRTLTVIPSTEGLPYLQDPEGNTWRSYLFIEEAVTYDKVETPAQAAEAARAFGQFQGLLVDLPGDRLHETIPRFHHTRSRFDALIRAVEADSQGRVNAVREEIEFARAHEAMVDILLSAQASGELPERITHNDTKLNNVMFDTASGEAICVIDLDTVMPGLALYDFGDMVRTATSPALEDETDLSLVEMQMPMFQALASGYVNATRSFLTPAEKAHLTLAGKLITFETGLRFLTDFLQGDIYFKTHRPGHNLDRCRTQFKLVERIEAQEPEMQRFVDSL